MSLPKISIVTPSYNQGGFLEETIQSILSQGYPNLEYIIIDGGSTDQSIDIIRKYGHQLTYWVSERDRGFGHAINKGFSKASGDIVGWVNSDDLLLPGSLITVGAYFKKHASAGLLFGDRHIINVSSILISKRQYFFYWPGQFVYGKTLPQECTFWRREIFQKVGPLDENLKFAIDFDLWCRISKIARIKHIPVFLGAFREQVESKSSTIAAVGVKERDSIIVKYFGRTPSPAKKKLFHFLLGLSRRGYRFLGLIWLKRLFTQNLTTFE